MNENSDAPAQDPTDMSPTIDKLITRGGGGVGVVVLFLVYQTLGSMQQDFATLKTEVVKVTTELQLVSPKDLLAQLRELEKNSVSKEDIRVIMDSEAPWLKDKHKIMSRLEILEELIKKLQNKDS